MSGMYNCLESTISDNYANNYQKGIKNKFPSNTWFDSECKTLKRSLNDYAILKDLNDNQYRENYYMLKKR